MIRLTKKFDRLDLAKEGFTVSRREIRRAYREVPDGFVDAVRVAAANIRKIARRQLPRPWMPPLPRACAWVKLFVPSTALPATFPAGDTPSLPPF